MRHILIPPAEAENHAPLLPSHPSASSVTLNTPSMSSVFLLSSDYYDEAGHIYIHETSPSGLVFAKIPIEFLRKGGLNTWGFVLAITNMLVDPVLDCPGTIRTASGDPIDLTSIPSEGAFVYTQEGLLPS
jgi:hypothetical protein